MPACRSGREIERRLVHDREVAPREERAGEGRVAARPLQQRREGGVERVERGVSGQRGVDRGVVEGDQPRGRAGVEIGPARQRSLALRICEQVVDRVARERRRRGGHDAAGLARARDQKGQDGGGGVRAGRQQARDRDACLVVDARQVAERDRLEARQRLAVARRRADEELDMEAEQGRPRFRRPGRRQV